MHSKCRLGWSIFVHEITNAWASTIENHLQQWCKSHVQLSIHSTQLNMTEDNKRYHLIINVDEKYAIVNALAFYHAHHIQGALMDEDEREQYMLAFQEDGPDFVDNLATKIANTF